MSMTIAHKGLTWGWEIWNIFCFLQTVDNLEHSECYSILIVKVDAGLPTHTRMINS